MIDRLVRTCVAIAALSAGVPGFSAPSLDMNLFAHLEADLADQRSTAGGNRLELGEAAVFVSGRLTDRVSYLAESTVRPSRYRDDEVKYERYQLRRELDQHRFLVLGKVHTPVNYWNDEFHHGRVLFPSIGRPAAFSGFIPIHDLGVRVGGENIGPLDLRFDLMVGSGSEAAESNRPFRDGVRSFTAYVSAQPSDGLMIGAGLYRERLRLGRTGVLVQDFADHASHHGAVGSMSAMGAMSTHVSHTDGGHVHGPGAHLMAAPPLAPRTLGYDLATISVLWENASWSLHGEGTASRLVDGNDFTQYLVVGRRLGETTVYGLADSVSRHSQADSHLFAIGARRYLGARSLVKVEIGRQKRDDWQGVLRAQLSVGI